LLLRKDKGGAEEIPTCAMVGDPEIDYFKLFQYWHIYVVEMCAAPRFALIMKGMGSWAAGVATKFVLTCIIYRHF
jgi:hypothetical protein